jgi:hypothetical protein
MAAAALPIVATAVVELAKLGLQIYFLAMATAGKTDEEIDEFYKGQLAYFIANPPETLPVV